MKKIINLVVVTGFTILFCISAFASPNAIISMKHLKMKQDQIYLKKKMLMMFVKVDGDNSGIQSAVLDHLERIDPILSGENPVETLGIPAKKVSGKDKDLGFKVMFWVKNIYNYQINPGDKLCVVGETKEGTAFNGCYPVTVENSDLLNYIFSTFDDIYSDIEANTQAIANIQSVPGPQGIQGKVGPAGQDGADGATGSQGIQGKKGNQGDPGTQGVQGKKGDQGDQGDPGSQGIQGKKGDQGDPGSQGIQGKKGEQGDPGSQGIQGKKGDQGDPGSQGIQGKKGEQGDPGSQGIQGNRGPQGPKGDQGDPGADGVCPNCPDLLGYVTELSCNNGKKESWEEGVDCGGVLSCNPCPNYNDIIIDQFQFPYAFGRRPDNPENNLNLNDNDQLGMFSTFGEADVNIVETGAGCSTYTTPCTVALDINKIDITTSNETHHKHSDDGGITEYWVPNSFQTSMRPLFGVCFKFANNVEPTCSSPDKVYTVKTIISLKREFKNLNGVVFPTTGGNLLEGDDIVGSNNLNSYDSRSPGPSAAREFAGYPFNSPRTKVRKVDFNGELKVCIDDFIEDSIYDSNTLYPTRKSGVGGCLNHMMMFRIILEK